MKALCRVLLAVAAIAFLGAFALGSVPVKAFPADGPSTEKVTCGSAFSETRWSSDDACEGPRLGQQGAVLLAFILCVVCLALGVGALVLTASPRYRAP